MKIMTFNVRVDTEQDGIHAFEHRKEGILSFLIDQNPDIIGFQEVKPKMLDYLRKSLKNYAFVGEPRDTNDEYNPIFFKKEYPLLHTETRWYGATPHIFASKHPEAYFPRIYTILHLNVKNRIYEIINTHFSHVSHNARLDSLKALITYYKKRNHDYPFILMGDFNAYPEDGVNQMLSQGLISCWDYYKGNRLTFHGYTTKTQGLPIDYIWVNASVNIKEVTIHRDHPHSNTYLSDHYPVSVIID